MRSLLTAETWLAVALIYFGVHAAVFFVVQVSGGVREALALRRVSAALQEVRREDERLREEEARLSDRNEIIRLARKNEGLIFPGEQIFRIPEAEDAREKGKEEARPGSRASRAAEFWEGLRRLLFSKSSK